MSKSIPPKKMVKIVSKLIPPKKMVKIVLEWDNATEFYNVHLLMSRIEIVLIGQEIQL
jgi:hypothetical protein